MRLPQFKPQGQRSDKNSEKQNIVPDFKLNTNIFLAAQMHLSLRSELQT